MAWTTPRTWVHAEIVTAAMMNAHVRDNQSVLNTARDESGRVSALSAATLADVSGANITGVAKLTASNAWTAGRRRFTSAARLVLPVGADKWHDLGGGLRRGVWVEGDHLHHIASNQTTEWRYLGEFVSDPLGAVPGSLWVEGEYLYYVDADGDERRCRSVGNSSPHADGAALAGSAWIETYVHWVREGGSNEMPGHGDAAHSDHSDHADTHGDTAHADSHSDIGHADSHGDATHTDHSDVSHADSHGDHNDVGHGDTHGDFTDHNDHADVPHNDSHTDTAHTDTHTDTSHTDTHTDGPGHGDAAHADAPEVVA